MYLHTTYLPLCMFLSQFLTFQPLIRCFKTDWFIIKLVCGMAGGPWRLDCWTSKNCKGEGKKNPKQTKQSGRMWRGQSGWSTPLCFVDGAGLQCAGRAAMLLWWPRLRRRELRLRTWWSAWTPTSPLLPSSSICSPSSHGRRAERQWREGARGRGLTENKGLRQGHRLIHKWFSTDHGLTQTLWFIWFNRKERSPYK